MDNIEDDIHSYFFHFIKKYWILTIIFHFISCLFDKWTDVTKYNRQQDQIKQGNNQHNQIPKRRDVRMTNKVWPDRSQPHS